MQEQRVSQRFEMGCYVGCGESIFYCRFSSTLLMNSVNLVSHHQVDGKDLVPARTYNPGVLDTTYYIA